MLLHRLAGLVACLLLLVTTAKARAACAADNDCKGDRICEKGVCVAPAARATPPAVSSAPAASAVAPAQPAVPAPVVAAPAPEPEKPRMVRHSTGMMVGGIVAVSLAPVALLTAGVAGLAKSICRIDNGENTCDEYDPTIYGGLLVAVAGVAVGIPLIVIGAKKEPVTDDTATVTIGPWATPQAAGMSVRVDL